MNSRKTILFIAVAFLTTLCTPLSAKLKQTGQTIPLRPLSIKNIAYSPNGKSFAVPNLITAGSVGIFFVSQTSEIITLPQRFTERDFVRSAGIFHYHSADKNIPSLAYIPLPELLNGYTVSYSTHGDTLAIAGNDKVFLYEVTGWKLVKTITLSLNTTRAVFSPDGSLMAAVSGGKIYIFQTGTYNLLYTVEPEINSLFADVAFSGSSSKFAVFEYKSILVDRSSRIRIYNSQSGDLDRDLPYLPAKPGTEPGNHYPLISYSPADSAIAITIDKSMSPRTFLVKSNDGTIIREFKGSCHAFSPDGSLLAVGGHVYSTDKWTDQGKFGTSALNLAFSPTERVLIVISSEHLRRYRIE